MFVLRGFVGCGPFRSLLPIDALSGDEGDICREGPRRFAAFKGVFELLFALKRFGLSPIGVEPWELADDLANA
jgi:hypothetical protein